MKIAVNYSQALLSLLAEDPNLGIDYIKAPTSPFPGSWHQFEDQGFGHASLPHLAQSGIMFLGHPDREQRFNRPAVERVIATTGPPYLSTHLEARIEFFPELAPYQHQNHPLVQRVLKAHFVAAVQEVKAQLNIPLIVENFPYYTWWWNFRWGSEPQFITEICQETDCGFLLDIAHARCSSWHMGRDLMEYIQELPLKRLREIHLGGVRQRGVEGIRDTHTALNEEDYQLLEWLLSRTDPDTVTIEYGGMPDYLINLERRQEPIERNNPLELRQMIARVRSIVGVLS